MSSYIEVKNVSKSFSGRAILQNISLPVEQGTTVGLVGANGSGKSVLFKIICGFEKPDQGSVYVRGNQLGKNGCDFPESLGVFINSPGFIGIYNGFQNLKFLADIQGKIGEKEIRQAMSKVGLDPDNKTKVDNYSLGMKQKLGLAQAIMEGQDSGTIDGIEWELKNGVLTIRGEGALRETPWSENVDRIQKVIIAAVGDSNSLFTRYHKLPGILCFVTSVCRRPRSRHSITWSATLMSCCVLQFLM